MTDANRRVSRIAIIGGGIAGLAAAYTLAQARKEGAPIEEMLFEANPRIGGVIRTEVVDGFVIEAGPDSFLAEKPQAAALARELGLGSDLMGSNDEARRTYILHRGCLHPLPDGLMFLVPTRLWPMITTKLLPFSTKLAAAWELFSWRRDGERADESVASFVRRHYGEAMVENIADPLLAGVYGGDSALLSVRSVLPRFWEMERQHGSLTRATLHNMRLRRAAAKAKTASPGNSAGKGSDPPPNPPLFMTLQGGLEQLTQRLAAEIERYRVFVRRRVMGLEFGSGGPGGGTDSCSRRFRIACQGDRVYDADAVVLALPAYLAGELVSSLDTQLSEALESIPYSSSMTVSLAFDESVKAALPPGFGFLVPRHEQRRMLACTFVHAKFNHRAPDGKALLRCFLGGIRDRGVLDLGDEEAIDLVRKELNDILHFTNDPLFYRVHRWPSSMAQYPVGHADCTRLIERRVQDLPGLYLAGNAYSGIGVSDCIRTGKLAASQALAYVSPGSQEAPRAESSKP